MSRFWTPAGWYNAWVRGSRAETRLIFYWEATQFTQKRILLKEIESWSSLEITHNIPTLQLEPINTENYKKIKISICDHSLRNWEFEVLKRKLQILHENSILGICTRYTSVHQFEALPLDLNVWYEYKALKQVCVSLNPLIIFLCQRCGT